MDVSKTRDIELAEKTVAEKVGERGLNLLINNAGAARDVGFPDLTEEDLLFHFNTNTVGPVMVLKAFFPLLRKAAARKTSGINVSRAAAINISSMAGSIADMGKEMHEEVLEWINYSISKAALNMAMRVVALTITEHSILVVNMCPGWVRTDMGSDAAPLAPSESVSAMLKTFSNLNGSHHGTFMDRNGNTIPF